MKAFVFSAIAVLASKGNFPSFDMTHAHCEITVPVGKSCQMAFSEIK